MPELGLREICNEAAKGFELLNAEDITSGKVTRLVTQARYAFVLLARVADFDNHQIALFLPGSSHKSVSNIFSRAVRLYETNPEFRNGVQDVSKKLGLPLASPTNE